jgi:hypothetical protein
MTLADALYVCEQLRPVDHWAIGALAGELSGEQVAVSLWEGAARAWCLEHDGRPEAVLGLEIEKAGVLRWWFMATADAPLKKRAREIVRFARSAVDSVLRADGVHRVQAYVLEDWVGAVRLAEAIGLEHEGRMRHYGNAGEHVLIMARAHGEGR